MATFTMIKYQVTGSLRMGYFLRGLLQPQTISFFVLKTVRYLSLSVLI